MAEMTDIDTYTIRLQKNDGFKVTVNIAITKLATVAHCRAQILDATKEMLSNITDEDEEKVHRAPELCGCTTQRKMRFDSLRCETCKKYFSIKAAQLDYVNQYPVTVTDIGEVFQKRQVITIYGRPYWAKEIQCPLQGDITITFEPVGGAK